MRRDLRRQNRLDETRRTAIGRKQDPSGELKRAIEALAEGVLLVWGVVAAEERVAVDEQRAEARIGRQEGADLLDIDKSVPEKMQQAEAVELEGLGRSGVDALRGQCARGPLRRTGASPRRTSVSRFV